MPAHKRASVRVLVSFFLHEYQQIWVLDEHPKYIFFVIVAVIERWIIVFCVFINLFQQLKDIFAIQKHRILVGINYLSCREIKIIICIYRSKFIICFYLVDVSRKMKARDKPSNLTNPSNAFFSDLSDQNNNCELWAISKLIPTHTCQIINVYMSYFQKAQESFSTGHLVYKGVFALRFPSLKGEKLTIFPLFRYNVALT